LILRCARPRQAYFFPLGHIHPFRGPLKGNKATGRKTILHNYFYRYKSLKKIPLL
jgi:hypothetical protein